VKNTSPSIENLMLKVNPMNYVGKLKNFFTRRLCPHNMLGND